MHLPSVLVLFNQPAGAGPAAASEAGVLREVAAVTTALMRLRVPHRVAGVGQLTDLPSLLAESREPVIFNLIEEFPGRPGDASLVPDLCAAYGKGVTGGDSACLALTLDKWRSKAVFAAAGLRVPRGICCPPGQSILRAGLPPGRLIVKPLAADASEGISADSVVAGPGARLRRAVRTVHQRFRQPALIEEFIGIREIHAAMLERHGRVALLGLTEIDFTRLDAKQPPIYDYAAKWLPESPAYRATPIRARPRLSSTQRAAFARAALIAWHAAGCRDYARLDFRLDPRGRPVLLEVNSNPDLSPDCGYAAAAAAAGLEYADIIRCLIQNAARRIMPAAPAAARQRQPRATVRIRRMRPADRPALLRLLRETQAFRPDEIEVAREVMDDALNAGLDRRFQSFVAETQGAIAGWICWGPTYCALGTYDIYWLAAARSLQGRGIGTALMEHAERAIRALDGRIAVVETNGRPQYAATRGFYMARGYIESARLKDFYAPGDDKLIYIKRFNAPGRKTAFHGSGS